MQINDISDGLNRRFELIFTQQEVDTESDLLLQKLQQTTPVGGFARGEAPIEKVRLLFGKQTQATATENLLNRHLSEFVSQAGFWADAKPLIEKEFKATAAKRYTGQLTESGEFKIIVGWTSEVPPQIKDYLGVTVKIPAGNREEAIENQIRILQARSSTNTPVNRAVIKSDTVMVDIEARNLDGTLVKGGRFDKYVFSPQFGDNQYFGKMLNDLIINTSVGDTFSYENTFQDNHPDSFLRGLQVRLNVTVLEVNEAVIPTIDDEFAVAVGHADLAALKESIGQLWDKNEQSKERALIEREYRQALLAANPIPVPEKSVQAVFQSSVEEIGLTKELIENEKLSEIKKELLSSAEDQVRLTRIFRYVYDLHPQDCRMTQEDLLSFAGAEAQKGVTPEEQLASLKGNRHFNHWLNRSQLKKVENWLLSQVKIERETLGETTSLPQSNLD